MKFIVPVAVVSLSASMIFFWIFIVISNTNANDKALTKKLDSIDLKINELRSENSFIDFDDLTLEVEK